MMTECPSSGAIWKVPLHVFDPILKEMSILPVCSSVDWSAVINWIWLFFMSLTFGLRYRDLVIILQTYYAKFGSGIQKCSSSIFTNLYLDGGLAYSTGLYGYGFWFLVFYFGGRIIELLLLFF